MNKYKSFINGNLPKPDYSCQELLDAGYELKVNCNKTNPDCGLYIKDKEAEGYTTKVIDLDADKHGDNMVHIWIKKNI